jgi:opacity protein-like surface antigen
LEAKPSTDLTFTGGKATATPTIQGAYDFALADWFSVGLAASYNNTKIDFTNITYKGKVAGDANATVARTSLAARALFHYGNKGRWDLYSGVRIGAGIWYAKVGADINDELLTDLIGSFDTFVPSFLTDRLSGQNVRTGFVLFQAQIIPLGARYYITDNIGVHAELGVGAPYYATIGANYRF